jgi:hypothetical protein
MPSARERRRRRGAPAARQTARARGGDFARTSLVTLNGKLQGGAACYFIYSLARW